MSVIDDSSHADETSAAFLNLLHRAEADLGEKFAFLGRLAHASVFEPRFNLLGLAEASNRRYTIRLANERLLRGHDSKASAEFESMGFFEAGGTYRLRSPPEQRDFHAKCRLSGLRVAEMTYADQAGSIVAFIDGTDLSQVLHDEAPRKWISKFLDSMKEAHDCGFSLGDRHSSNAIVDGAGAVWQIDLDMELCGEFAAELDVAQGIFYSLFASRQKFDSANAALDFCARTAGCYKLKILSSFLHRLCRLKGRVEYAGGKYMESVPAVEYVLAQLDRVS